MNPASAHALSALTDLSLYLPLFGLAVLVVVLVSLTLRRERWLLPGTLAGVMASLFVFGLVEYQGQLQAALQQKPAPVEAPAPVPPPPPVVPPPAPEPVKEEPPPPEPPPVEAAKVEQPKLISVDPSKVGLTEPTRDSGDLKTIREAPAPKPAGAPAPAPAAPPPQPVKTLPAPTPAPVTPPPQPAPAGPPAPKAAPASGLRLAVASPAATSGHLLVEIKGPLLETVKGHQPEAHLMIVVDGKYRQAIKPTRVKEDRATTELGQAGPVTAINYFWENVSITFENLPAGPHSVMIDVSLEDASRHFSAMTGAESTKNDWNGFVDISPGQTTTISFGGKNWMSQQLDRLR